MKWNLVLIGLLACVLMMTSGCASILCGSTKTISIQSSPTAANFTVTDSKGVAIHSGVTPSSVTLKRGSGYFKGGDYKISVEKPGYKKAELPIKQGIEWGWYGAGNAIFGGLIGWFIVDPLTGGMYTFEDTNVTLVPMTGAMVMPSGHVPASLPGPRPVTLRVN